MKKLKYQKYISRYLKRKIMDKRKIKAMRHEQFRNCSN